MDKDWLGRRWYEFRTGYQTYIVFLFGFSNFMLILYNFTPVFKDTLPLEIFAVIIFGVIVPVGVAIGYFHNKRQVPTESKIQTINHAYRDKIVPESKETFQTQQAIFNQQYLKFQNELLQFQTKLAKKQCKLNNAIVDKFDLPKDMKYEESEIEMIDSMTDNLVCWADGLNTWEQRLESYSTGALASKLLNEAIIEQTVAEESEPEPIVEESNEEFDMMKDLFAEPEQIKPKAEPKDNPYLKGLFDKKTEPEPKVEEVLPEPVEIMAEHKTEQKASRFKKQLSISLNKKQSKKSGFSFSKMMNKPLFTKKEKSKKVESDDEDLLPP